MKVDQYQRTEKLHSYSVSALQGENRAGQYIARGVEDLGAGLKVYKDRANDVVTTEAMTKLKYAMNDKMYGEKGWINEKGKQAVNLQQRGDDYFRETLDKLGADMDGEQRALFEQKARQYGLSVQQTLGGWEAQKIDAFTQETLVAEAQAALETATMSYGTKLYEQNVADFDMAVKKYTDYKGMGTEAAAQYLAEQRGKQTLAVVNNMLERNPDNPWAAKRFFEAAKKSGRVDLTTAQTVEKHLRPVLDAASVRSLALKFGNEIDAANVKENETNPDSPRDKSATIINRIMNDASIPLRLRSQVAHAASTRAQFAKAARDEEYANTLSIVEEKQRQGIPETEIPEFYKLKPKDQEKMLWGPRTQSDFTTTTQWIIDPTQVTVKNVQANRDKLTGTDYQTWLKKAQEYAQQPAKLQEDIQNAKISNDEFTLMLATLREKDFKDEGYRKSPKFYQERYAYEQAVRSEMIRKGVKELPREERIKIAETVLNPASKSTSGWNPFNYGDGLNLDATRGEVITQNILSRATGRTDLVASLKDWSPANPITGNVVDDAKNVKTRLTEYVRKKKGSDPTLAEVTALWAKCFDSNGNRLPIKELDEK
jgi:hypothetical protein|nr:MAG TPA: hypothetical protein [Caudoviricetes sp.]